MKRVISISEMAEYCQVTTETIRRWIDSGAIPSSRTLGGHRRIEFKDFVKFLEENNLPLHDSLIGKKKPVLLVGFTEADSTHLCNELVAADKSIYCEFAEDAFEAGHKVGLVTPQMIIFNAKKVGVDLARAAQQLKSVKSSKLIKLVAYLESGQTLDAGIAKMGVAPLVGVDRAAITDLVES